MTLFRQHRRWRQDFLHLLELCTVIGQASTGREQSFLIQAGFLVDSVRMNPRCCRMIQLPETVGVERPEPQKRSTEQWVQIYSGKRGLGFSLSFCLLLPVVAAVDQWWLCLLPRQRAARAPLLPRPCPGCPARVRALSAGHHRPWPWSPPLWGGPGACGFRGHTEGRVGIFSWVAASAATIEAVGRGDVTHLALVWEGERSRSWRKYLYSVLKVKVCTLVWKNDNHYGKIAGWANHWGPCRKYKLYSKQKREN